MAFTIQFLGQSAFLLKTGSGLQVLIDPWLENPQNPEGLKVVEAWDRLDGILLTHAHQDHLGNTLELTQRFECPVYGHFELAEALLNNLGFPESSLGFTERINPGGTIDILSGAAKLSAVPAVHGSALTVPKGEGSTQIAAGESMGFVIDFKGGPTLYHTGDTDLFSDMKLIPEFHEVDVMLVCIGDRFTMGPRKAARAVSWVAPKMVIPMHYGTFPVLSGTPEEFRSALNTENFSGELHVLNGGERLSI